MTERLEMVLREAGVSCRVEARERLAIVIPGPGSGVRLSADDRARVIQLSREAGFSHVAVELLPEGAPLPGG
jgi:hypothetical protein